MFQSQNLCFKLDFFVSKSFFAVKISENNRFRRSPGSNDKCRLHRKWCRRHFCFFVSCDNRRREYLSRCSPRAGTHTRKLTFRPCSHTRSNSSPPSHSRCALLDTLAPSTSCFGRFHCAKNNTQLFLTCYISPLKISFCSSVIVVIRVSW